ncbi:DegT/DnrJ/EryC1/StrS family aminotransferase [Streptoalloteichus hindustanus]|uniref:Perosamine synthetase n=1 Tax=Streptoalloteichus hindustanus TaxID=2017 RepID=A0A1M5IGJ7_STRHI|nr:DegT/DnrJ/EryC1/StrS family aminotransferase [Streptoalloteichus hindustanus]SHG27438.1 perosamine synthetase [Streptoalloteichus hindustanus]
MSILGSGDLPSWPQLGEDEARAAAEVILGNELSQNAGDHVSTFEEAYADRISAPHVVAVNNGTSALHLALVALGIGPADEVLVPAYTFVGSATPVLYVGATPVFVDVVPDTYCVDPADAARKITERTRALVVVHLNGYPAAMTELVALARRHDLRLIEDAAQAHGAEHQERHVGTIGDVGCFSFWQDKTITTGGEGGAVVTSDPRLAGTLRSLRDHGLQKTGTGLYHHARVGFNYRLTSAQAAIGTVQVGKLTEFVAARRRNAALLDRALGAVPGIRTPSPSPGGKPAPWKYTCRLTTDPADLDVVTFLSAVRDLGVPAQRRYPVPLTRQPIFAGNPTRNTCPRADLCAATAFSLPVHPALTAEDLERCVAAVTQVLTSPEVAMSCR